MQIHLKVIVAAVAAATVSLSAGAVAAAPVMRADALLNAVPASTEINLVRWRGRGRAWGGVAAGIAAGALIGGVLATRPAYPYYYPRAYPYYYPPAYYVPAPPPVVYVEDDAVTYCMRRYRSYDPRSGTYLGYDGYRHPCP